MEREKKRKGYELSMGFPSYSDGKESPCCAGDPGSTLGWEDPLEKGMAIHSSILLAEFHRKEEPGGVHRVTQSQAQLKQLSMHACLN